MSDATKKAIENAIEAHMAEEHDMSVMLTGYILQAMGSSAEDNRDLLLHCGLEGQSSIVSLGLLTYIDYNVNGLIFDSVDEETD